MNVGAPILDVVPGPRGLVLHALTRMARRMTGRELAQFAGVPVSTTARILSDLVDAGIVQAEPVGAAVAYRLNSEHLVARAISELAGAKVDLVKRLRREIKGWEVPAVAGWLFGSTARGDGGRHSDVDILLVTAHPASGQWETQVGHLADLVERWTGNHAQVVEHTVSSLLALEAERSPLTANLRVDGLELVVQSWTAISRAA